MKSIEQFNPPAENVDIQPWTNCENRYLMTNFADEEIMTFASQMSPITKRIHY